MENLAQLKNKTFPSQFCRWKIIFFSCHFFVLCLQSNVSRWNKKTNRTRKKKYNVDCGWDVGGRREKCRARWGRGRHQKNKETICVPYLNFMLHSFSSAHLMPTFIYFSPTYWTIQTEIDSTKLSIFIIKLLSIGIEYWGHKEAHK